MGYSRCEPPVGSLLSLSKKGMNILISIGNERSSDKFSYNRVLSLEIVDLEDIYDFIGHEYRRPYVMANNRLHCSKMINLCYNYEAFTRQQTKMKDT